MEKERKQLIKDNNRVLKNEYNKLHKNELQKRVNIQTKNNELLKKYNSNLEQYKKLVIAIEKKNKELKIMKQDIKDQTLKLENIKNEITAEEPKLTKLQEQEIKKQVEESTRKIKEEYQTEKDNLKTYKELYRKEREKSILLEDENNRLKSTIKIFFDFIKERLGNVLNGIL